MFTGKYRQDNITAVHTLAADISRKLDNLTVEEKWERVKEWYGEKSARRMVRRLRS